MDKEILVCGATTNRKKHPVEFCVIYDAAALKEAWEKFRNMRDFLKENFKEDVAIVLNEDYFDFATASKSLGKITDIHKLSSPKLLTVQSPVQKLDIDFIKENLYNHEIRIDGFGILLTAIGEKDDEFWAIIETKDLKKIFFND